MVSVIFGLATAASIILALRRAEGNLRFYLYAQLVSLAGIWLGNALWGIWSYKYAILYVIVTLPILWSIARICWDALEGREFRARSIALSFLLAAVLGRLAYVGLLRPIAYFDYINILLGVGLAWGGTLLGFASAYLKRWDLGLILAVFWLSQALSSFGWTLHLWERLNWIIDPLLGITAFLLLAWRLRDKISCNV